MTWVARGAFAVALASASAHAQVQVTITDLGPGPSGRVLLAVLASHPRVVAPDTGWFVLPRGQEESGSLVVLGRSAAIGGNVAGDVVVVGGDLYVRPGAHIGGRGTAIGGGAYPSALAIIERGTQSFRDNSFSITPAADGFDLAYVSMRVNPGAPLLFPGIYGIRGPTYDRVNGVTIPFGPSVPFAGGNGEIDVLARYRSNLGTVDPSIDATLQLSRRARVDGRVARGTFSNDDWIWSDLVNSLSVLVFGADSRNYYRADRADLTVHHAWEWSQTRVEPYVGGRMERSWSVGPGVGGDGPWSLFHRDDSLGTRRPNPAVDGGHLSSVLAGTAVGWNAQELTVDVRTSAEVAAATRSTRGVAQVTSDASVSFPTFGEQQYAVDIHWVTTPGGVPPSQRFVYMGGSGTLPFDRLLEFGGDELLLIDQRYSWPLANVTLGLLGSPTLLLRHRLGSAGFGRLPAFEQILGVGVLLTFVRGEVQLDPVRRRFRVGAGLSFSR